MTANSVVDPFTGAVLEYKNLKLGPAAKLWIRGFSNEVDRLVQGGRPQILTGSNTIHFIHPSTKPVDRKATYCKIVVTFKPHKVEKHCIRFTVGGNRIDYFGLVTIPTADM